MTDIQNPSFRLIKLFFPRIDGAFNKTPESDVYDQAFRVEIQIIDNRHLIVIFGISLASHDRHEQVPAASLIVEAAAHIELNVDLGEVSEAKDIPLMGNMLALLFPFIREKVNYFFSNNHISFLLSPINTIGLVNESTTGIELLDLRKKEKSNV